jgi:heme-degrading monooxygenase HmoA
MRSSLFVVALLAACAHGGTHLPPASEAAAQPPRPGIARVWHGRVPAARADEYAAYLASAVARFSTLPGNLGYELLRDEAGPETHFMVVSYWTTKDAIRAYAGDDITKTRSLPRDPEFLIEPEPTVRNYELVVQDLAR